MKYYALADVHGYFTEMKSALERAGYFEDKGPKKIVICGDLFDRGDEALKVQEFVMDLLAKDEIILIRGNHEDLTLSLLNRWHQRSYRESHHNSNGTVDTILQLTGAQSRYDLYVRADEIYHQAVETPFIKEIIPKMVNYYETESCIFVHGWIPCSVLSLGQSSRVYSPIENWREASEDDWSKSRWINGMEAHHKGIVEKGKTIICGHWHASFGHCNYEGKGGEFENNPDFAPFVAEGIVALDACTIVSGFVNCVIIEE